MARTFGSPGTRVSRWFSTPTRPSGLSVVSGEQRTMVWLEVTIVLVVTFGLAGLTSLISLIEAQLSPIPLGQQTVALNSSASRNSVIDLCYQLLRVARLLGWAALGGYLLLRATGRLRAPRRIRRPERADILAGLGLAAIIGLPGLAFYLVAHALGLNAAIAASALADHWWRYPMLVLAAFANAVAEEVVVVAYVITQLRRLGWTENRSLAFSAVLRGSYHLYQGFGGGVGNVVMGVVFARYWQHSNRLWPLILAHTLIDVVAFTGYALLRDHASWLP